MIHAHGGNKMATAKSNDSILASIKRQMPGSSVPEDYQIYDDELMADINAEFAELQQLGVGDLDTMFEITGYSETWGDYIDDPELLALVPQYIAFQVKMMFDTPKNSNVVESLNGTIKRMEFRIMDAARRYQKRKEDANG